MDDSSAAHIETDDDLDTQQEVDDLRAEDSAEIEGVTTTTLVEVTPGIAVVFGEVPEGLELFDLDLLPSFDRAQLNTALGTIGNIGTVAGKVAEAISSAQGLYRVNDATLSLLQSGGKMDAKDGAKLGAIFKNGELVAQARFIPASMTAATAIAAIGPAVAMLALQMQLGEISGLVRTNIALTTQTLKTIRNEQRSELEALVEAVDQAIGHARSIEAVPDSVWDSIAASYPSLLKQMKLYRKNVADYVQELGKLNGRPRRQFLESNAEAMMFDTYSLLISLKAYAEYQAIKAVRARTRGADDESEARLFELITRDTPIEIQAARDEIASLTKELVRELRIIAELPGRATIPLTKNRKDSKASQLTCAQLLEAIEPVANLMCPPVDKLTAPNVVLAPEDLDLDPYLQILRRFMDDAEVLQGIAFPHEAGGTLAALVPAVLAKRVDASWDSLAPGKAAAIVDKFASSMFVAVTDQRVVTASPRTLLREGELGAVFPLNEVRYVRPRRNQADNVRSTISIATDRKDFTWMFPSAANDEQIDHFVAVVEDGVHSVAANQLRIESAGDRASEENSVLAE